MVDINTNIQMLLQTYKNMSNKNAQNNVKQNKEDASTKQQASNNAAANTTANNTPVNNTQNVPSVNNQPKVEQKPATPVEVVSKVSTTTNTNSDIFKTGLKSIYNNILMVNPINIDRNGRVVDYKAEFLNTYKSEITSTLYNKIVNKTELTEADLAVFEQGIAKLSDSDKKMWKSEIDSVRNQIKSSIKEAPVQPFSGVKDGVLYQNGNAFTGTYSDGKYYQNGALASGMINGKCYENGALASGVVNGLFYRNGVAFTGTYNNQKYENGIPVLEDIVEEPKTPETKVPETKTPEVKEEEKPVQEEKDPMAALGLNGELDETFKQGSTGDCWVLSSLIALNATEEGKAIIKDAISVDKDGNAVITFKGINKSYTITKEEIAKYDTDNISNDAFSNGDNDALVLEIAAAKLRVDLATGKVQTPIRLYNYNNGETKDLHTAAYAGYSAAMMYFFTGKQADWTYTSGIDTKEEVFATLARAKNQMAKGDTAITFSLGQGTNSAACVDTDTPFSVNIKTGHAFAVTDLTDETITIVNPWDSSKAYTMTWEEFAKMNITQFAFLGL